MSWIVARQHFAVMQPAADGERALLYAVAYGRLVERGQARDADDLRAFAARVDRHLRVKASALRPEDVDGTIILAAWLRARGERDGYVFPLEDSADAEIPQWTAALESLVSRSTTAVA